MSLLVCCVSLKVVRRTPAIVITLKTTSSGDKESKEIIEHTSLPVDVAAGSSAMGKTPEVSKTPAVAEDSVTSEKTLVKSAPTSTRTKKSKSSRKRT